MRMLRFGGPKMPPWHCTADVCWCAQERKATWFVSPGVCEPGCPFPPGHIHGMKQTIARPGDLADPAQVCAHTADGPNGPVLTPNADYYVEQGFAAYVEVDGAGQVIEAVPDNAEDPFDSAPKEAAS